MKPPKITNDAKRKRGTFRECGTKHIYTCQGLLHALLCLVASFQREMTDAMFFPVHLCFSSLGFLA